VRFFRSQVGPSAIPRHHLHGVVHEGDIGVAATLLGMALCDADEPDDNGNTPLMHCAAGEACVESGTHCGILLSERTNAVYARMLV
jgi:hypothetical protein